MKQSNKKTGWVWVILIGLISFFAFLGDSNSNSSTANTSTFTTASSKILPVSDIDINKTKTSTPKSGTQTPTKKTSTPQTSSSLSNDNYYTNSQGNKVHSPARSSSGVPAGASAQCSDGTYSFSQSRRGTCSHHGGVARWL